MSTYILSIYMHSQKVYINKKLGTFMYRELRKTNLFRVVIKFVLVVFINVMEKLVVISCNSGAVPNCFNARGDTALLIVSGLK